MILRGGNSKIFSGKSLAAILSEIDNLFRNSVAISVNKESKLLYEPALPEPLPKLAIQEGKLLANSFPDKILSFKNISEYVLDSKKGDNQSYINFNNVSYVP